ncbi:MAG: RagB/SusD family nutrient uptake outer membrane protein, partial [Chitinophagaceae bacterium]
TSGTAKSLAAKTKLYRQDWATALALTQQVIASSQYTLEPDFAKIWTNAGENGVESIFEIQAHMGANRTDDYTNNFARAQGVRGAGDWDLGWGWNTPTQNLVDAFPAGDKRKDATILYSGQNDGYGRVLPAYPTIPRRYWNKKVHPEPSMQTYTGERQAAWVNQRVLRYADVLLMAAEAANEVGGAANETLAAERTPAGAGAGRRTLL